MFSQQKQFFKKCFHYFSLFLLCLPNMFRLTRSQYTQIFVFGDSINFLTTNFAPLLGRQPHSHNVNHCICQVPPKDHWEPPNKNGSLSLAECLVGFELGKFQFLSQCFNLLGHSLKMTAIWPFAANLRRIYIHQVFSPLIWDFHRHLQ